MNTNSMSRRDMLKVSAKVAALLASIGVVPTGVAFANTPYNAAAFDAKSLADLAKAVGGSAPVASKDVTVTGPDIAENGMVVPVGVASSLAGVKSLMILVEKNPNILSASFDVSSAIDMDFQTRVKMGQSSNVYGVALMNDGKVFYATKEIKVTLGGCGG